MLVSLALSRRVAIGAVRGEGEMHIYIAQLMYAIMTLVT